MKADKRHQMAQGFAVIGMGGLLVAAFVMPDQWQSGNVRAEAQIGVVISIICVLLAAAAERSARFGLKVFVSTLLVVSTGYLAVVPFALAQAGWNARAVSLALALVAVASASAVGLWFLRGAAQQTVQPIAAKTRLRLNGCVGRKERNV